MKKLYVTIEYTGSDQLKLDIRHEPEGAVSNSTHNFFEDACIACAYLQGWIQGAQKCERRSKR